MHQVGTKNKQCVNAIILLIRTDKSIDPLNVLAVTRASPSDCQAGGWSWSLNNC